MEDIRQNWLLLGSLPFYVVFIGLEMILSHIHDWKNYELKDTFTNVCMTILNILVDLVMRGIAFGVLMLCFNYHFFDISNPYVYWIGLVFGVDFCYYWLHRTDHYVRLFWASHVTHHSSEYFNITVGFRSTVFEPIYRFIFYIPLALVGFKPLDIFLMHSLLQIYGAFIHTNTVKKLGILEYILVTPSHHRVHHASNIEYLDKNMGMTFIIWDKLFGTFAQEKEDVPVVYGLTKNIEKKDPVNIVFHEWIQMFKDLKRSPKLADKIRYMLAPPGWSHDGSTKTSNQLREELAEKKQNL